MKRVEGTSGIKLIECVSPARNRWRIRWDVQAVSYTHLTLPTSDLV